MGALIVSIELCAVLMIIMTKVVQSSAGSINEPSPSSMMREEEMKSRAPLYLSPVMSLASQTETVSVHQLAVENPPGNTGGSPTSNTTNFTSTTTPSTTTSFHDPNSDLDDPSLQPTSPDNSTNKIPNKDEPSGGENHRCTNSTRDTHSEPSERVNIELSVLWYSVFMVYVSFVKLIYHNVAIIKRYLTEPGILMIFGIIWELISRQVNSNLDVSPRFNSRIFFYLFLPSTVLESASILSNKWLLLNLLPILIHSIVGTLLYGSAIAFTIHSMSKQDLFNIGTTSSASRVQQTAPGGAVSAAMWLKENSVRNQWLSMNSSNHQAPSPINPMMKMNDEPEELTFLYERNYVINAPMLEVGNLTLTDCLVFGSMMSSLDSTTLLGAFSMFQVNEKLYYLVLGESLMNNAVVLIVFNLLLEFINASRLTVVKIYIAIIQFFITLIGSIFVGLLLASVALLAVRLIKRFQVPNALTSYQNQCLAMIETLLVLKLAYLTYTLGSLAGLSSIVSLATFGVLQDQYIRLNLNLRSQLTFRQVVLATKTMGFSLVYPLLGMLLVDVAYASQYVQQVKQNNVAMSITSEDNTRLSSGVLGSTATKLSSLASQATMLWNFKFVSLVTVISIAYRFGIVIVLSLFCNLISSRKVKVKFREQILMAYGGLKGPLAVALVHRLIEHDDHRDKQIRNKHLFMYTILFITLLSVIFKGAFIGPLVKKMQISLDHPKLAASRSTILFNAINNKVIESTTHAVGCLVGRTKSPYDRLFEFNESRIKPWLARHGSNTNWLANLYDKLLLDETLDSITFQEFTSRSLELHPTGSFTLDPMRHNRGSKTSVKLDTIDEHGGGFIDDDELNAMNTHLGLSSIQQRQQQVSGSNKQRTRNGHRRAQSKDLQSSSTPMDRYSTTGMKDFVMLDLESVNDNDQARKRPSKSVNGRFEPSEFDETTHARMMSSSSGGDELNRRRESSSDKEDYISQLERHLESKRKAQKRNKIISVVKKKSQINLAPSDEGLSSHVLPPHVSRSNMKGSSEVKQNHSSREKLAKHHGKKFSRPSRVSPSSKIDPDGVASSSSD